MFKLVFLLLTLPSSFLLIDTATALGGDAIALAQEVAIANQSQPTNILNVNCGKYCENYPEGITEVRLRDWQR